MHKDRVGNYINVGDDVVYISPYYRRLKRGKVAKLTPSMVRMEDDTLCDPENCILVGRMPV
jgi:hypothetical protein